MSLGQLVVLLIVAMAIANFLRQVLGQRPAPDDAGEPRRARPTPTAPAAAPPERRPAADLPRAVAAPSPRPRRARRRLRSRGDARRAIVLMTLLGPCPGLEPPASREEPTAGSARGV